MNSRFSSIIPVDEGQEWIREFATYVKALFSDEKIKGNIEIELKYADPNIHKESRMFEEQFRRLSFQAVLWLRKHYTHEPNKSISVLPCNYQAGFSDSKKFYSIKEFLESISKENSKKKTSVNGSHAFTGDPLNFYRALASRFENSQLTLKEHELRMDVNHEGIRYSYSHDRGWHTINKARLVNYDLLYCNTTVRMTVACQTAMFEENMKGKLESILFPASESKKVPCLRLKNILKFEKKEQFEISLSEVLVISNEAKWRKLIELVDLPEALNNYLVDEFANFYAYPGSPKTNLREVECEVTEVGLRHLRELLEQGKGIEFEGFFESMLQDFCSLFHSDYCIKRQEIAIINEKFRTENAELAPRVIGRLENDIGHYMRNELAEFMDNRTIKRNN